MSVVVPLFNEAASVERLLAALDRQVLRPAEVVCVDAGSTDETAQRVSSFASRFPIRLLREGRLNPGAARNEGTRAAANDWIAFIDGGTEPEATWLLALMTAGAGDADVVFGSYEPVCDSYFRRSAALAYVPARSPEGIRGPFVASMALRRQAFARVGGFPSYRASEDLIFFEALKAGGLRIAYAPGAVVRWETAPGPRSTFRRFALYSRVNLEAGRGQFWHLGLARQYLVVGAALVCGFLLGSGPWILLLLPAWLGSRALRAGWAKRRDLPFSTLRPDYVAGAAGVLLLLDLATWTGLARWVVGRGEHR